MINPGGGGRGGGGNTHQKVPPHRFHGDYGIYGKAPLAHCRKTISKVNMIAVGLLICGEVCLCKWGHRVSTFTKLSWTAFYVS